MPIPIVAIEISAPEPPASSEVQALLAACNNAASGAQCIESRSGYAEATPAAVAIVAWQGERVARLEVGVRSDGATRWTTRKLEFRSEDELPECWRSVGFVIGTIVGQSSPESDGVLPERPSEPEAVERRTSTAPPTSKTVSEPPLLDQGRPSTGLIGLEADVSPVDTNGPWLVGGRVRAAVGGAEWVVVPTSSIAYAVQSAAVEGIQARWFTATLGVRHALLGEAARPLALGVVVEALARRQEFHSSISGVGRDDATRWLAGAQFGVDAAWEPARGIWIGVGVDAFVLQGRTHVRQLGEDDVLSLSRFGGDLSMGTSYRW